MKNESAPFSTVETPIEAEDDGLDHLRIDIRRALPNRRLDKYLSGRLGKATSRTALQRYIREGNVTVNGSTVKPSYVIRTGDVIDMTIPADRPQEIVEKSLENSLCFGLYQDDRQLGFARVVTDKVTFAWICDVIIDEDQRGVGLGKWLMECLEEHPDV